MSFPRGSTATEDALKKGGKRVLHEESVFGQKKAKRSEVVVAPPKFVKGKTDAVSGLKSMGHGLTGPSPKSHLQNLESLSFGKLNTGCLVLGLVLQINQTGLLISLPGGLTGVVPYNEVSDVLHRKVTESTSKEHIKEHGKTVLPPLDTVVRALQVVRCYIIGQLSKGVDSKKKTISLSMRSSLVNKGLAMKHFSIGFPISGCVASKEDHGYIISTGVSGVNAFLPEKNISKEFKDSMVVGQPVECVTQNINEGSRTLTLRTQPKAVHEAVTHGSLLAFTSLCPGMKLNVIVDEKTDTCLVVTFLGLFFGVIDNSSLNGPEQKNSLSVGDVLQARIIMLDPAAKIVRFSIKNHILEMRASNYLPTLGSVMDDLVVSEVLKKLGVILKPPAGSEAVAAPVVEVNVDTEKKGKKGSSAPSADPKNFFIYRKNLSDAPTEPSSRVIDQDRITKVYSQGAVVRHVRVKGFNLVEGWVLASNIADYIDEKVIHSNDVSVGQVLEVVVTNLRDFGLVLKLGSSDTSAGLSAICPTFHTSDVVVEGNLKKKFKVGQRLNMRVWEVSGNAIIMTNKKTIVDMSAASVIQSYEDATVGKTSTGVISKINSVEGITVHFFNKVKGLIAVPVLIKQGVLSANDEYRVGQVIQVVIIRKVSVLADKKHAHSAQQILYLGLDMNVSPEAVVALMSDMMISGHGPEKKAIKADGEMEVEKTEDISNNSVQFVSGVISKISIEENSVQIALDDGRKGRMDKHHFFDFAFAAEQVFSTPSSDYVVGFRVEKALVLSENKGILTLTSKPLLIHAAEALLASSSDSTQKTTITDELSLPSKVADLSPGQIVAGFVLKVETYGVLVRFRDNLNALAPRPNLSDKFISTPVNRFQVGDSMRCVVQRVDLAKERALVTLKSSMVTPSSGYLTSFFKESFTVNRITSSAYVNLIQFLSTHPISSTIDVTVSSIEEYGVVFLCSDDSTLIVVRNSNLATTNLKVGKAAKVVVIDIDTENFVLEGSTHIEKFTPPAKGVVQTVGTKADATILSVKERYLVVVTASGALGYVAISDYHNPKPDLVEYVVDTVIHVSLLVAPAKKAPKSQSVDTYPHSGLSVFTLHQDLNSSDRRAIVAKVIRAAEDSDSRLHREISGADGDADQVSTPSTLVLRQKFIEGLRVGYLTKWVIHSVSSHEVSVLPEHSDSLMMNIKAKIHISNAINPYDSNDKVADVLRDASEVDNVLTHESHPFNKLKVGNKIWCYVLQIRKSNKTVESVHVEDETHSAKDEYIVYLSTTFRKPTADGEVAEKKEKGEKADFLPFFKMVQSHGKDAIKSPVAVAVVVTKITEASCVVSISPYLSAVLHFMDVSYDPEVVTLFKRKAFVGLKLVVAVTHITDNNGSLQIKVSRAVIESKLSATKTSAALAIKDITALLQDKSIPLSREYKVGEVVSGILNLTSHKVPKPPGVLITLRGVSFGRVCVTEIRDLGHWNDLSGFYKGGHNTLNGMKHGDVVKARVLSINKANNCVELSLRPSRVSAKTAKEAVAVDASPEEGELVKGYVANISKKGCFLRLSSGLTGQVMMKDLSDEFVSEPEKVFPVGKLVEGRVLSVNHVTSFAQLTLKASLLHSELSSGGLEPHNFVIGDTVTGVVKTVTEFGVFVALDGSNLVGLSRRVAANLDPSKSLEEEYEVGDIVRAKILTLSALKVGLGLKEHYFRNDGDEEDAMDVEQILKDDAADFMPSFEGDSDSESEAEEVIVVKPSKKEKVSKKVVESVVEVVKSSSNKRKAVAPAPVHDDDEDEETPQLSIFDHSFPQQDASQGLFWDDFAQSKAPETQNASESDSNDEDDEQHTKKSLRTRQKEALNRKAERDVYTREAKLVDGTLVPQGPDDFERSLIATPNSSFLWIQYMAHYLESSDVVAAREIATRALKTINFREEDEKFNVWVTLLNVEHKYGTMDTLEAAFARAISESKTKKIFLALAETYENAGDNAGAQGIFDKALKRPALKKSKKVWAAYLAFKLRSGDVKGAKEQFARSMQSLSRHKHVEVIAKYALSEFDYGSMDRGRVVFEDLLSNYPKRTDIWHLYLDKEIKLNNFVEARNLFERIITSKASARNLKSAFKKYLNFELTHGDEESQELVRQKARDYVNNIV